MAQEKMASQTYVDRRLAAEIGSNEFTPIDPAGAFMIPFRKVSSVQQYMKLSITRLDGVWVPDLDQKVYEKDASGGFVEVTE